VVRNRIKRQIRESFRATQDSLKPLDYVVIARSRAASAENLEISQSMDKHWSRFTRSS